MRKRWLVLCAPLTVGCLVFACLALSAQSAVAETAPTTQDAKAGVITVSYDAEALRPVVLTENKIIAEGVQLVPESESLASQIERLHGQMLGLATTITHDAADAALVHRSSFTYRELSEQYGDLIERLGRQEAAVNHATDPLVDAWGGYAYGGYAGITRADANAAKKRGFAAGAMLYDLNRAAARAIRLMKKALTIR